MNINTNCKHHFSNEQEQSAKGLEFFAESSSYRIAFLTVEDTKQKLLKSLVATMSGWLERNAKIGCLLRRPICLVRGGVLSQPYSQAIPLVLTSFSPSLQISVRAFWVVSTDCQTN